MEIHLPEGALEESVERGIRATIMAGALQLIMKELTTERLNKFVTGVLDEALKDLSHWKLKDSLMKLAEPMIAEYCRRPEIIDQVESAVKKGMDRFLKDVPEIVYEEAKSTVVRALVEKYDKRNRY